VVGVGVGDVDPPDPPLVSDTVVLEHPEDVLVVYPVTGIDHDALLRGVEHEDVSAAGHLETENLNGIAQRDTLDVRVEPVACGLAERLSGPQDAVEDLFWVLAQVVEFLDDVIDVLEE